MDIERNRKKVLSVGIVLVAILIVLTVYQAYTFKNVEDKALVCYIMAVPIFMTGLSFVFSYVDLKDSQNDEQERYYLRRGYIFGIVMFVLSLLAIIVMYSY